VNLHAGGAWKLKPFADCPAMYTSHPPCWFHRFMLRVLLGWKWERE
jgi:hypothetical protein